MDKRKVVVDTNVLIDSPEILLNDEFDYVLPYVVLQELDGLKKNPDLNVAVRYAIKIIYQQMKSGALEVVGIKAGGKTNDEKIIQAAQEHADGILTGDIGARAVALFKGVEVIGDDEDLESIDYTGFVEVEGDGDYEKIVSHKTATVEEFEKRFDILIKVNEFVIVNRVQGRVDIWVEQLSIDGEKGARVMSRVSQSDKPVKDAGIMITALDPFQRAAWAAVISDVPLTVLEGKVGSSKTLSALVGLLVRTKGQKGLQKFKKIYYSRAPIPVDRSLQLGFMPGPQPLDAQVFTPDGISTMGAMQIGDKVLTPSGTANVTSVIPQGERPVYTVHMSDGSVAEAADTHIWNVELNGKKDRLYTTTDLMYLLKQSGKLALPKIQPAKFSTKEYPLDPYFIGAMLGDGSVSGSHVRIAIGDQDAKEMLKNIQVCVDKYDGEIRGNKGNLLYTISTPFSKNPIKEILTNLGMQGKKAPEKFIPTEYLFGDVDQRVSLLQGLIDTDGSVRPSGEVNYYTTSKALAEGVRTLVKSLGGSANVYSRDRRGMTSTLNGQTIHRNYIEYIVGITGLSNNPARLSRKATNFVHRDLRKGGRKVFIDSVEFKGVEKVQCISIDSEDHLYLTNDFTPTHNSIDEKAHQWIAGISSNLKFLYGDKEGERVLDDHFSFISLESIQGLSLQEDEALFIDEYQLLSKDMLKQILTRVGEGGKVILAGDPSGQTYGANRGREGFKVLQKVFGNVPFINYVQLNSVYRSKFVEFIDQLFEGIL